MKFEMSLKFFEKYSNTKFRENPSCGNGVVPCGWTDGQIGTTKLVAAFRDSANVSKRKRELSVHTLKVYTGSRDTAPLILNPSALDWGAWSNSRPPAALSWGGGEEPAVAIQ
jgi:hypothetical protein